MRVERRKDFFAQSRRSAPPAGGETPAGLCPGGLQAPGRPLGCLRCRVRRRLGSAAPGRLGRRWRAAGHGPDVSEGTTKWGASPWLRTADPAKGAETHRQAAFGAARWARTRGKESASAPGRPGCGGPRSQGPGAGLRGGCAAASGSMPPPGQAALTSSSALATALSSFPHSFLHLSSAGRNRLQTGRRRGQEARTVTRQRNWPEASSSTVRTFNRNEG